MRSAASFLHPRDEILQAIQRIYRYRMTTTSGGNLSIREENGDIWITPARLDKGSLRREDIVCVRADGTVVGPHRPSSELPFHQEIYRTRHDIRGIVHAHPVALVAFSLVHRDSRYAPLPPDAPGLRRGGFCALRTAGQSRAWGATSPRFSARASTASCWRITARSPAAPICRRPSAASRRWSSPPRRSSRRACWATCATSPTTRSRSRAMPRPEWTAFPHHEPTTHEKELRARLAEFVRRAYRQRLFISTQGSFSARVDAESFLITPYRQDRGTMDVHDLVLVRNGDCEAGGVPSRAARMHEEIYRQHRGIGAIINAYPVNATAFSVTGVPLDSRTIPESYIVIREVSRFPFGLQFSDAEELAARMLAAPSRRAAGERWRAGHRRRHPGSLRPPGGSGIHRGSHHQLPYRRHPGAHARGGDARTGSRVSWGSRTENAAASQRAGEARKTIRPKSQLERLHRQVHARGRHAGARLPDARCGRDYPARCRLVYDNYNALAIGFGPSERASEAIFSIALYPRWVTLFFLQGAGLPDPKRLLKGSGKVVRHIVLASAGGPGSAGHPGPDGQGVDTRGSRHRPNRTRRSLVIRSICAKQRPRRPAVIPGSFCPGTRIVHL